MSTTIPFPFAEHHDPLAHDAKINETVGALIQWYERHLGDADKATEIENTYYHQGQADALCETLLLLLSIPDDAWDSYQGNVAPETVHSGYLPLSSGAGWGELIQLYHRTSYEAAWAIVSTRKWVSAENTGEVYASNRVDGQATGYGPAAVQIMVPAECAVLDDEFPDGEKHYRVDPTAIMVLGPAS